MGVLVLFLLICCCQILYRRLTQVGARIYVENLHIKRAEVPRFHKPWMDTSNNDSSDTVACNISPSLLSFPSPS